MPLSETAILVCKAENFPNVPNANFDLYVISFIRTNFEAFTAFSAIFKRIRRSISKKRNTIVLRPKVNQRKISVMTSFLEI